MYFSAFYNNEALTKLLEESNVTLESVLDQESVMTEVKFNNTKLITFLCKPNNFDALISYVTEIPQNIDFDPTESHKDLKLNKFPFVASSILSADNDILTQYFLGLLNSNKLMDIESETIPDDEVNYGDEDGQVILHDKEENTEMNFELPPPFVKFLKFLDNSPPLNPTLSGYFANIMTRLFTARPDIMAKMMFKEYFNYLEIMTSHLYSDSMRDLVSLLLKCDATHFKESNETYLEQRLRIVNRIINNIFEKPIHNLDSGLFIDLQNNSSLSLVALLSSSHEIPDGNKLVEPIFDKDNINKLIQGIFNPSLVEPISHLIGQICQFYFEDKSPKDPSAPLELTSLKENPKVNIPDDDPFVVAIVNSIEQISALFDTENKEFNPEQVRLQFGGSYYPFGQGRLKLLEVLFSIVKFQNKKVEKRISETNLIFVLLNLLTRNPWNNILHNIVTKIIKFIIDNGSEAIKNALFKQGYIFDFIINAAQNTELQFASKFHGTTQVGYISHIIVLANALSDSQDTLIKQYCLGNSKWQDFKQSYLNPVNEKLNSKICEEESRMSTPLREFPRTKLPFEIPDDFNGEIKEEIDDYEEEKVDSDQDSSEEYVPYLSDLKKENSNGSRGSNSNSNGFIVEKIDQENKENNNNE